MLYVTRVNAMQGLFTKKGCVPQCTSDALIKPVYFVSCNKYFKYKLHEAQNEFYSVVTCFLGRF